MLLLLRSGLAWLVELSFLAIAAGNEGCWLGWFGLVW